MRSMQRGAQVSYYPFFLLPLFWLCVLLIGRTIAATGMDWYGTLQLPSWSLSGWWIGLMWTGLYAMAAIASIQVWNAQPHDHRWRRTIQVFALNAFLNIFWSYLFFVEHHLSAAVWCAGLLALSVLFLIVLIWPRRPFAAIALIPYAAWSIFAAYLTSAVMTLNG